VDWLAGIFFLFLLIAAPYFALIGGLLLVFAIGAFVPDVTQDDAVSFLLMFEAVGLCWVLTKIGVSLVTSYKHRRAMRGPTVSPKREAPPALPVEARNAYATLGIGPNCTPGELHRAWRNAVKSCHPDLVRAERHGDVDEANERLSEINVAYEICRRRTGFRRTA